MDLMEGFRLGGRLGCTIKKLILNFCNASNWRSPPIIRDSSEREVSVALIKGLRDGLFPNLEELWTPGGDLFGRTQEAMQGSRRS